jgi:single-strand DNA-binding protein
MRIATTESYTDHTGNKVEQTEWHRVVTFQKTAEQCARYLTKGRLVYVEGKVQTRQWQDQQGQGRTITEIRAEVVRFLDSAGGRRNFFPEEKGDASPSENRCFSDGPLDIQASAMDDIPF